MQAGGGQAVQWGEWWTWSEELGSARNIFCSILLVPRSFCPFLEDVLLASQIIWCLPQSNEGSTAAGRNGYHFTRPPILSRYIMRSWSTWSCMVKRHKTLQELQREAQKHFLGQYIVPNSILHPTSTSPPGIFLWKICSQWRKLLAQILKSVFAWKQQSRSSFSWFQSLHSLRFRVLKEHFRLFGDSLKTHLQWNSISRESLFRPQPVDTSILIFWSESKTRTWVRSDMWFDCHEPGDSRWLGQKPIRS